MPYRINKLSYPTTMQVDITVAVELTRQLRFRLWLAKRLIRLAARVLGCGIEVKNV